MVPNSFLDFMMKGESKSNARQVVRGQDDVSKQGWTFEIKNFKQVLLHSGTWFLTEGVWRTFYEVCGRMAAGFGTSLPTENLITSGNFGV